MFASDSHPYASYDYMYRVRPLSHTLSRELQQILMVPIHGDTSMVCGFLLAMRCIVITHIASVKPLKPVVLAPVSPISHTSGSVGQNFIKSVSILSVEMSKFIKL